MLKLGHVAETQERLVLQQSAKHEARGVTGARSRRGAAPVGAIDKQRVQRGARQQASSRPHSGREPKRDYKRGPERRADQGDVRRTEREQLCRQRGSLCTVDFKSIPDMTQFLEEFVSRLKRVCGASTTHSSIRRRRSRSYFSAGWRRQ